MTYREFALDANQSAGLISLDSFQIFLTNVPNLGDTANGQPAYPFSSPPVGTQVTKIYDIGATNYILLNSDDAGSGSGRFDMDVLVPDSTFTAGFTPVYVTLYNKFGVHNATDDGFEEWAYGKNNQPITGTIEGFKFNDLNGNGVPNNFDLPGGEPGVNGVTINLYKDMDGNGQLTAADGAPIQTNTTSTVVVNGTSYDGLYTFQNVLPSATYFVREVAPSGSVQTSQNPPAITINAGDTYLPSTDPRFGSVTSGRNTQDLLAFGNLFKRSPTLVTTASESPGNVVGVTIPQDSAVLSGGFNPTGTITFTLHAPNNTVVDTETVTVNGNATYTTSNVSLATQVGTYTWTVHFSGDTNNNAADDQGGAAEQVSVIKSSPTIATLASQTGSGVVGVALLSDSATISGGFQHTGSITFTLTAPNNSTVSTQTVTVTSGVNSYSTPTSVLATQVGTYVWHANYSGDGLNNSAIDNGVNESLTTVKSSPTIATLASQTGSGVVGVALLSDSATISGGFQHTGSITFTLTAPNNSTVSTQTVTGHQRGQQLQHAHFGAGHPGRHVRVARQLLRRRAQ